MGSQQIGCAVHPFFHQRLAETHSQFLFHDMRRTRGGKMQCAGKFFLSNRTVGIFNDEPPDCSRTGI